MFGKKKNKAPVDPRVEEAKNLVAKKHPGYDANLEEAISTVPASDQILAVLPSSGFSTDIWILTNRSVYIWSASKQFMFPTSPPPAVSKGIRTISLAHASGQTADISAHPDNSARFYTVLMNNI